ncbi:hypothetical protein LUZ60_009691 [Juncus effusus]|nr:hypothetical protein LUZ60_009691 [Juncus effusus]
MAGKTHSVMDYKAVGDGKTDDSQAFLNAWKDICADASVPTLLIPSGKSFAINKITFQGPCKSDTHIQKCNNRPYLLGFEGCNNVTVKAIHLKNSPSKHLTFHNCNTVTVDSITINAPGDSPNTDGILLEACQTVNIIGTTIGTGDDCIAIITGCSNFNISKVTCGPGHGISVGSLGGGGSAAAVENILVSDCNIFQAMTGVRIKTWQGGSGYARQITFQHINITKVETPIVIDQSYNEHPNAGNAVAVSNVTFNDIHGTSSLDVAININCDSNVPCRGLTFNNINLSKDGGGNANATCQNAYGTIVGTVIPSIPLTGS